MIQGHEYFEFMMLDHYISLSFEQYNCLIGFLVLAGQLNGAIDMMKVMPYDLDVVMLNAMVSTC